MARVKRGVMKHKRHHKILKEASGYWGAKSRLFKSANEQLMKSGQYAYRDRRNKKREFRQLWIARINAACRAQGVQYSRFIAALNAGGVELDRKVLSEMAISDIEAFNALVASLNITTPAPTHNLSLA
ncbi:MAG: 50S ribosomal protein L20 [Armatimonadota bacterium]|nr:50S ribosomal protein L20 [Armatimonadota bacterium]